MKPTEKIALIAGAVGAAVAGGLIYLDMPWHWGWSIGVGFVIAAGCYDQGIKQAAAERIVDRDVLPKI